MPIACQSGEGLTGVCHVFTLQKYYFFVGERYEYRKTCVASDILSLFLREDVILRSAAGYWAKWAFAARLSNWQLFAGGRGTATLRRPRRGDVCAVLRLCHARMRTYPGAERENMWHVDRKSPLQWEKRGTLQRKCASFCTKRPVFRIFLPVGRSQGRLIRRQVGRSIFGGDSMRTKEGKEGSLPQQKIPFARARVRCKGDLFEMCCPMGNGD